MEQRRLGWFHLATLSATHLLCNTSDGSTCPATYEPSVIVIAQGRKRVDLGRNTFIYDASRFLLTSIDLPVVSRVIEASEQAPCLAMALKLKCPLFGSF
jgi:hypothetical protein